MKCQIGRILLSYVMSAVLLSGCAVTIAPTQVTEETPSLDDLATPAPTTSPQEAQATATPAP